jgi:DNA-binding transcriptional ArsR family regulator
MVSTSALAETASLVGDPARANILSALMDGRALTAAELARAASVTPQTASGHLARLTAAGLLVVAKQGRHRYHRLASPGVARMLEGIMAVAESATQRTRTAVSPGPRDAAMRIARTCYDHLAGRLAVGVADAMVDRGYIEFSADGGILMPDGAVFLRSLGVDLDAAEARAARRGGSGRVFCRACLDWSERRPHVAGAVGAALCDCCFALNWVRRIEGTRAVAVTPKGQRAFRESFGVDLEYSG